MVPVSSIISFFQVGAVNNGRNGARIAIMGSKWGMNFLLGKMSFCQLLSYTKRSFMPCFSTQIVQSRAESARQVRAGDDAAQSVSSARGRNLVFPYARVRD